MSVRIHLGNRITLRLHDRGFMIVICLAQLWKELGKIVTRRGVRASVESVIILRSQVSPAVKGKHRGSSRRSVGSCFLCVEDASGSALNICGGRRHYWSIGSSAGNRSWIWSGGENRVGAAGLM